MDHFPELWMLHANRIAANDQHFADGFVIETFEQYTYSYHAGGTGDDYFFIHVKVRFEFQ